MYWIKTTYKLPDVGQNIIFVDAETKEILTGFYFKTVFCIGFMYHLELNTFIKGVTYHQSDVSYWMPLPKFDI